MLKLNAIHHIAIICSDYQASRNFYTKILGLTVEAEHYRAERNSYKLDLRLGDRYAIELFSFPNPPRRLTAPEATGLRHLAFEVSNLDSGVAFLNRNHVSCEPVRTDPYTGKRFTFFQDPDGLPLELYEK